MGVFSDRKSVDDLRIVRTLVIGCKWVLFSSLDFQHQQFVNIFFILPDLLPKFLNLGCDHWLPEAPQFLYAAKLRLLRQPIRPQRVGVFHHLGIYDLLMNAMGRTVLFPMTVVALAHILYPVAAVPIADHWYEGITAVTADKQPGIAMRCPVAICRSGILFQKQLYLCPFLFGDDCRIEVLMPNPTIMG